VHYRRIEGEEKLCNAKEAQCCVAMVRSEVGKVGVGGSRILAEKSRAHSGV
jgi:hypothetical protein